MTVFHHHGQRQLDTERGSYSLWDQPDPEVPSSSSPKFGWWLLLHSKRRSELLNDMLHQVEQWHGPLPTENGDLSDIQCWGLQKLRRWGCLTRDWWDKLKKMSKAECIVRPLSQKLRPRRSSSQVSEVPTIPTWRGEWSRVLAVLAPLLFDQWKWPRKIFW